MLLHKRYEVGVKRSGLWALPKMTSVVELRGDAWMMDEQKENILLGSCLLALIYHCAAFKSISW